MNTLGIENIIKYCDELNIILDISFNYSDNICIISLIKIPIYLRGKGLLKKILKMLILDCNKNNLILALTPSNRYGSNLERLEQFYKSFGFIENKSSNKNFLTKETLIKYPSKLENMINKFNQFIDWKNNLNINKNHKVISYDKLSFKCEGGITYNIKRKFNIFYKNLQVAYCNGHSINWLQIPIFSLENGLAYRKDYKPWILDNMEVINEFTILEIHQLNKNGMIKSTRVKNLLQLGIKCVIPNCNKIGSKFLVTVHNGGSLHIDLYTEDNILMNIDHINPKSKGGKNDVSNYQLMCKPHNTEKGNKENIKY